MRIGRFGWSFKVVGVATAMLISVTACAGGDDTGGTTTTGVVDTTDAGATTTTGVTETTAADTFDAEAYFSGATIQAIIPHSAGGNTDIFGRFMLNKLQDHIPGNPRIAVTNVGGLGGIAQIFEAPEDKHVIGVSSRSSALYGTANDPDASQVPDEIQVVGGVAGDPRGWVGFGNLVSAYPSMADAIGAEEPAFRFAATVGSPEEIESDVLLYSWMCDKLDLPCEFVQVAEDSSADTNLMVQRGEVNLQGGTMITFMREYLDQIREGSARLLMQYAETEGRVIPLPDGVETESIYDILPADLQDEYDRLLPALTSGLLGTMIWTGPDTPPEVIQVLQDAYAELVTDQSVLDELNKIMAGEDSDYQYSALPLTGEDAQTAFDTSSQIFADNYDLVSGYREQYWTQYWGG
jgi:hypothetical protein